MKTTKTTNKLNRKLKRSEAGFALMLILMILGILGIIASTFIWVWIGWQLAWKIGLTGLLTFFLSGLGWAVTYNLVQSTIKSIQSWKNNGEI